MSNKIAAGSLCSPQLLMFRSDSVRSCEGYQKNLKIFPFAASICLMMSWGLSLCCSWFLFSKNLAQNAWGTETVWAPMMMRSSSLRNWVTWQESTWRSVLMCWVSSEVSKWLRRVQSHGPTKSRNILAKRDADYWLPQHCDSTSLLTCQSIVIWFF